MTRDNLGRSGYSIMNWCCMWRCNGELVDHLLIRPPGRGVLWGSAYSFAWVEELFGEALIWHLEFNCLMWFIWRERNNHTFKDVESLGDQLLASFVYTLFDWSQAWELTSSDSLPMFIDSLLSCI